MCLFYCTIAGLLHVECRQGASWLPSRGQGRGQDADEQPGVGAPSSAQGTVAQGAAALCGSQGLQSQVTSGHSLASGDPLLPGPSSLARRPAAEVEVLLYAFPTASWLFKYQCLQSKLNCVRQSTMNKYFKVNFKVQ